VAIPGLGYSTLAQMEKSSATSVPDRFALRETINGG
jgi:hypothetical protein